MHTPRINEAIWIEARQRWQINVQRDGERKTFTCSTSGTRGKIEAERKADKWLKEGNEQDCRLDKAWAEFLTKCRGEPYRQHEKHGRLYLLPRLKHKRLSKITSQDWQDCIDAAYEAGAAGKPLSKKSLSNIRGTITAFSRFCKKSRKSLERPEDLTIPRDAPVKEKTILQPDQLRILFTKDTIRHYKKDKRCWFIHAWRFEVLTGLRPGEIAGLRVMQDLDEQLMMVQRSINQHNETTRGKNTRAKRPMMLHRRALSELAAQREMLQAAGVTSPWVFPDEDGNPMDPKKSYKSWLTFRTQNGLTSSLYELRHTFVSLSKADMPAQLLKRIVGHGAGMDTFGIYGHDVDGELERAAAILDTVWDRVLDGTQKSTQSEPFQGTG